MKNFIKISLPSNKIEFTIFALYLIIFSTIGYYIAEKYTLVFDQRIPWDAYFSFDNRSIVLTGGSFERHPLANYFFFVIRNIALWFSDGKYNATFRIVLALCSAIATTFSVLYVFKYLVYIIKLNTNISIFLTVFFSLFSTVFLLSFTPETYTYTLPLLMLFLLYSSQKIQQEKNISLIALSVGTMTIGGMTITNAIKAFIPLLFQPKLFKKRKVFLSSVGKSFLSIALFIGLFLYRMDFNYHKIISNTEQQYEKFSQPKFTPLWDMIVSWFAGGTMLFPSFIIRDYHSPKGFQYKALFMDTYSSWVSYLWISLVLMGIIWAIIKQRKNKLVYILLLFGAVDIFIHIFLKFGLHTAYIYGGHYVFLVPLFLGWLISSYPSQTTSKMTIFSIIILLFTYLFLNNLHRIQEFHYFIEKYYS